MDLALNCINHKGDPCQMMSCMPQTRLQVTAILYPMPLAYLSQVGSSCLISPMQGSKGPKLTPVISALSSPSHTPQELFQSPEGLHPLGASTTANCQSTDQGRPQEPLTQTTGLPTKDHSPRPLRSTTGTSSLSLFKAISVFPCPRLYTYV